MITVTTTVFKKTTLALIGLACAAGIVFSVGLSHQNDTEVRAATTNTQRVWATFDAGTWNTGGALMYVYTWDSGNTSNNNGWPGDPMTLDSSNSKYFYDLPIEQNMGIFTRVNPGDTSTAWDQTGNLEIGEDSAHYSCFVSNWGGSTSWSYFTPTTTTVVSNFAATIDTDTEACSESSAQAAVNAYNALSTFEQDQFDVLSVGGGFTGLQRLNFLKTFYSISTPLNINNIGDGNNSDDSLMTMLIIGAIGLTTLGGYYIISRKKHLA